MSMMSPETYRSMHKDDSWDELIAARNELVRHMREFESRRGTELTLDDITCPSPGLVYTFEIEYLREICELMSESAGTWDLAEKPSATMESIEDTLSECPFCGAETDVSGKELCYRAKCKCGYTSRTSPPHSLRPKGVHYVIRL